MACSSITLAGIGLGCKDQMGGIKEVYIAKEDDITEVTLDSEKAAIDGITMNAEAKFKTYKFRKGTSSFTSTMTTDEAAGTLSVSTVLSMQFTKMETAKRLEIMALCMDNVKCVVLDSNGKYWFLGYDYPVTATSATGVTGTNFTDFGGYTIELTDNSKEFPYELSDTAVTAFKDLIEAAPVTA